MSNVLKVEFKESYLTENMIRYLLNNYELELKTNNFKTILKKEIAHLDIEEEEYGWNPYLFAIVEYMSTYNQAWPFDYLPNHMFAYKDNLISIVIPDNVKIIGEYAFNTCSRLMNIIIPDNVTYIDCYAFKQCTSLTSIEIPISVTEINDYIFDGCNRLKSINISDNVTYIGNCAFNECRSLTSITIPESVTFIGDYVFDDCNNLTVQTKNQYVIDYCKKNKINYKEI